MGMKWKNPFAPKTTKTIPSKYREISAAIFMVQPPSRVDSFTKPQIILRLPVVLLANSRVDRRIGQVGEEIHGDVGGADGQDAALYQVVIAVGNGLDGEAAEAGPGEDGLGDDGAGEERTEL